MSAIAVVLVAVGGIAILLGRAPSDAFSDTATLCSFGFVIVYGAIAAGASLYLQRRGELHAGNIATSIVAVALLIVPAVGSVYPVPPAPANFYPYAFAFYVACGVALLWRRRRTAASDTTASPAIG